MITPNVIIQPDGNINVIISSQMITRYVIMDDNVNVFLIIFIYTEIVTSLKIQ